ncbi:hypothetical protein BpHYR1_012775 [Brachionus plicatilis]|uniref:Uncharacterized protein n=1 Tax=Brachionus plicatilis TaxID=10195 RepID=A0A3M7SU35_BRAPC|nr:hypothetical protein BpHYR1_012775 [Brachionus plicatilis]
MKNESIIPILFGIFIPLRTISFIVNIFTSNDVKIKYLICLHFFARLKNTLVTMEFFSIDHLGKFKIKKLIRLIYCIQTSGKNADSEHIDECFFNQTKFLFMAEIIDP